MKFFSPDSKFAQMMTALGEMMLLNLSWIISSLPLLTVGAANTAMYTVLGRRLRGEGSGTVVPFFKAWWSNLKMGSLFWIGQMFVSVSMGMIFFLPLPGFLKGIGAVILILVTILFSVIYPQIARFRNRWIPYLRNAVILLVLRLGWVVLNTLVCLVPVIMFLLVPMEFLRFGIVWILFGFSGVFYLSSKIMVKVLEPLEELAPKRK